MLENRCSAVLVDFDGVLRHFDGIDVEADTGLPTGAVARAAFSAQRLLPAITGRIDDEQWRAQVVADLELAHPGTNAAQAVRRWSDLAAQRIDQAALALCQLARKRATLVLVTNATTRLPSDLRAHGLERAFDVCVNSALVGAAKPDSAFFHYALRAAAVGAERALFIDDSERNISAALALGIDAVHYNGLARLEEALQQRGLLPTPDAR